MLYFRRVIPAAAKTYRRRGSDSWRETRPVVPGRDWRFVICSNPYPRLQPGADTTVGELGEFAVIDRAVRGRVHPETTVLGPGDDAAVVLTADGRVVVTTDMLIQDRHFRLDWSTPTDIGAKCIAQNGADIAAMGAKPTAFLVALGCPAHTPVQFFDELHDGLWSEAMRAGGSVVGGDLVQADQIVISITALGDLDGRPAVLRSGARPGDVLALSGVLGWSAAGLTVLQRGIDGHHELVATHRVPQPPYPAGVAAAVGGATSMTDISDGLLADVGHIASASRVHIDISVDLLPVADELRAAADSLSLSAIDWILAGGEDHALVATFPPGIGLPGGWMRIGNVGAVPPESDAQHLVTVDGAERPGDTGWTSF